MDDIAHWRDLIMVYKKRLRALERQAAQLGSTCPPNIQIDIEETTQRIAQLEYKMSATIGTQRSPLDSSGELQSATGVRQSLNARRSATTIRIECPYPGMVPFRAEDAHFFYGRDDEIRHMLQHLRYHNYLFIIGPSGSGKSSLLEAGLLPRLKESSFFPQGFWLVRSLRPGDQPTLALAQVFEGDLAQPNQTLADLLERYPPAQRLLLVVDQLEELFTQAEQAEQTRFIAALQSLRILKNFALLITMRADFYSDLMNSDLWPVPPNLRQEIAPLRGEALRRAIRQPAQDVGVELEANLLERLLADAANEPGVLPLIQETMILLWEQMDGRVLPLHTYERLGSTGRSGLAAAVSTKADAVLDELAPAQQVTARRILLRLVQFGEGRADTRRQQSIDSLRFVGEDPELFQRTLHYLTNNRLLTLNGEIGKAVKIDIAHESLITGWPILQAWLTEWREAEQTRRRLEAKVVEWTERVRRGQSGGLLDDVALFEAENWLGSPGAAEVGFDERLLDLVKASRIAIHARSEGDVYRDQMRAFYEIAYTISTATDYNDMLSTTLNESHKLVPYDTGLMLLSTGKLNELYVAAAYGLPEDDRVKRISVGRGPIGQTLRSAEPCIIGDLGEELQPIATLSQHKSACVVPLLAAKRAYGIMLISSEQMNAFTREQLGIITALANYVIISLYNAQLVRELREERAKLLSKEEEVRHQLARDLHDGPAQALAAIAMNVEFIKRLIERDPERVIGELDRLSAVVKHTTYEVRTMLFDLRPLALATQDLETTLRQYFERFQSDGSQIILETNNVNAKFNIRIEGTLFNIIQELVNNALKHAKAQRVWVRLKQTPTMLEAIVQDDGCGFDLQKVLSSYEQRYSFGLLNIEERAKLIGGFAEMRSAPGQGTTVRIVVPLTED